MDEIDNPFVPGAGSPPPELAGREAVLERARITLGRIKKGRGAKSLLLVGLRGVGKTVLLNEIEKLAKKEGYETINIEAVENKDLPALIIPKLRQILFKLDSTEKVNQTVKRGLRVLRSFANSIKLKFDQFELGLEIRPETGTADSGDLEADLPELFVAVGEAAASRNTAIALIIDELQYLDETELSSLIMAIHKISQSQLPLVLMGAGLPQLVGKTGNSKSYAERLFEFPIVGKLEKNDAIEALQEPVEREGVSFQKAGLNEIVKQTEGYPYFLQEWGYQSWNLADKSPITKGDVEKANDVAIASLDESFFRVRFDRLTPREREYLRAMAELGPGPHRSGDIAELLNVEVQSVAPIRSGLIKKGMVYSPSHGDTAFTVPLFDQFLRRNMPAPSTLPQRRKTKRKTKK